MTGIDALLPPGLRGLMLTGLLAALASTLDTHLNWGASYWSNDVYRRLVCRHWLRRAPGGHELVVVARLSNVGILLLALVVMANLGSIQEAWVTSLLLGAGMGSVLALRWLWERITLWSEVAAIAASLVTAPLLLFWLEPGGTALVGLGRLLVPPPGASLVLTGLYVAAGLSLVPLWLPRALRVPEDEPAVPRVA